MGDANFQERGSLFPAEEWEQIRLLLLEAADDTEKLPTRDSLARVIRFACSNHPHPPEHVFTYFRRLHGIEEPSS